MTSPEDKPSTLDRLDQKSGWTHPYMIYIVLTAVLFVAMVGIAYWALSSDILPKN